MVGRVVGVIVAALAAEATAECDSSTWLTNTNIQSNLFMVLSGGWSDELCSFPHLFHNPDMMSMVHVRLPVPTEKGMSSPN